MITNFGYYDYDFVVSLNITQFRNIAVLRQILRNATLRLHKYYDYAMWIWCIVVCTLSFAIVESSEMLSMIISDDLQRTIDEVQTTKYKLQWKSEYPFLSTLFAIVIMARKRKALDDIKEETSSEKKKRRHPDGSMWLLFGQSKGYGRFHLEAPKFT